MLRGTNFLNNIIHKTLLHATVGFSQIHFDNKVTKFASHFSHAMLYISCHYNIFIDTMSRNKPRLMGGGDNIGHDGLKPINQDLGLNFVGDIT